jgi:hypothetical protein
LVSMWYRVVRGWDRQGREFVFVEEGDDGKTTEVCVTACLGGSGEVELVGGGAPDVGRVGRTEVCFCKDDEVCGVRADHGEGEFPFVFGDSINVEEEDVETG